jgi:Zn-dependent protease
MREPADWTIPLGTWQGIPLRLHSLFLLFCGGALYLAQLGKLLVESRDGTAGTAGVAAGDGVANAATAASAATAANAATAAATTAANAATAAATTAADAVTAANAATAAATDAATSVGTAMAGAAGSENLVWLTAVGLLILYLSLLAHEFCHWWVARRYGVEAPLLLIGPLGGMTEWESRDDPKAEIMTHVAGPLANLAIALIPCLATLRWCDPTIAISGLLDPLQPEGLPLGNRLSLGTLAGLAFWINWTLFVVNLFPAFPFDGGRILRASVRLTRPQVGTEIAEFLVARLARLAAFGLAVTALFVLDEPSTAPVAPWFALSVLAGTVLFTGLSHERRARSAIAAAPWLANLQSGPPRPALRTRAPEDREVPSDEFVESDMEPWSDDDDPYGTTREADRDRDRDRDREKDRDRDRDRDRERSREREREREIARIDDPARRREHEDERRVDEILAKLHEVGLEKLTPEERGILERASARYRQRSPRPQ